MYFTSYQSYSTPATIVYSNPATIESGFHFFKAKKLFAQAWFQFNKEYCAGQFGHDEYT